MKQILDFEEGILYIELVATSSISSSAKFSILYALQQRGALADIEVQQKKAQEAHVRRFT